MGKRGPKPKFTDIACPNEDCQHFDLTGKGNVIAMELIRSKVNMSIK